MQTQAENILIIKQRVIENFQDIFVWVVSAYNFWTWVQDGTYKYFNGWEIYNWVDFFWTMVWQVGSMYLLYRRINYVRKKEAMAEKEKEKEKTDGEDLVVDVEQLRKLGHLDRIWESIKGFFK
jgi:hypothetical protein